MILVYPSPWSGTPPKYLIAGDKIMFIVDEQSAHNMQKVGIPQVAMTQANLQNFLTLLDPNIEHPLSAFDSFPEDPFATIRGGRAATTDFANTIDGGTATTTVFTGPIVNAGGI